MIKITPFTASNAAYDHVLEIEIEGEPAADESMPSEDDVHQLCGLVKSLQETVGKVVQQDERVVANQMQLVTDRDKLIMRLRRVEKQQRRMGKNLKAVRNWMNSTSWCKAGNGELQVSCG